MADWTKQSKAELEALAQRWHVDVSGCRTKADVWARVMEHLSSVADAQVDAEAEEAASDGEVRADAEESARRVVDGTANDVDRAAVWDGADETPTAVAQVPVARPVEVNLLPSGSEWHRIVDVATALSRSNLVRVALRGKVNDIATVLLYGRDLGLRPSVALARINVIEGMPSLSAEMMVALVRQHGHRVVSVCTRCARRSDDADRDACGPDCCEVTLERGAKVLAQRGDTGEVMAVTWTIDDAVQAGLVSFNDQGELIARSREGKRLPWEAYPKSLLWARAVSQVCRMLLPDVLSGLTYTGEELGAYVDEHGEVIDADEYDVPPGDRPRDADADVTPLPEDCGQLDPPAPHPTDGERVGLCCRAVIKHRATELPDEERGQLQQTWQALRAQGRVEVAARLRACDVGVVGPLLDQFEAKARRRGWAPAEDAEVLDEPTGGDDLPDTGEPVELSHAGAPVESTADVATVIAMPGVAAGDVCPDCGQPKAIENQECATHPF